MKSHVMTSPFHLIGRGILRGSVYCKPGKYYQRSCLKIKLGITNNIILQLNTCVWLLPSPEYQIQELMWVGSPDSQTLVFCIWLFIVSTWQIFSPKKFLLSHLIRRVETDKDPKANIVRFPILSFIPFSASKVFSIAFFLIPRSYYHYWMEC